MLSAFYLVLLRAKIGMARHAERTFLTQTVEGLYPASSRFRFGKAVGKRKTVMGFLHIFTIADLAARLKGPGRVPEPLFRPENTFELLKAGVPLITTAWTNSRPTWIAAGI